MKVSDVLKESGIPSKEIKIRISAGRVLVNGHPVNSDIEIGDIESSQELGEFLFDIATQKKKLFEQLRVLKFLLNIDVEEIIDSNFTKEFEFLKGFVIIRFSKRDALVLKKK